MDATPERLLEIRALFDRVMECPAAERAAFLADSPSTDASVKSDVAALVALATPGDGRSGPPPHLSDRAGLDSASLVGQRLGAYEVVRLIGMGGMGAVYEAVRADDQYRKRVAIKLVQGGLGTDLTLRRFRQERQILATLDHRNVATLVDGGVTPDGLPFLVMEYVLGEPITVWCAGRRLGVRDRLALFRQVCAAMQHAHSKLVVHRDLKPGNVLVTPDGTVKLLDFGIAKLLVEEPGEESMPLTRSGTRPFTPEYASPEQIRGDVLTTASDIYSLGVVLFELMTGRRPHHLAGLSLVEFERLVETEPAPRPSAVVTEEAAAVMGERSTERLRRKLRGELDNIMLTALRKEPSRRYASVEALALDAQRYLLGLPVQAQPSWAGYRIRKFVQRNAAAVAASALVVVALVGGVMSTTAAARRAQAEQEKSRRVSGFLGQILSSVKPSTGGRDVPVSEVLDQAAKRLEGELGAQPEVRAELETVIGQSYQSLGNLALAEQHFTSGLEARRRFAGSGSASVVEGLNYLGELYLAKGEFDRADSTLAQALTFQRARTPTPDTVTASLLSGLASIAERKGRLPDAARMDREVIGIRRQLLGEHADLYAVSLNNLAVALGEQNQWAEADSLMTRSLAILRANHPEPHVYVVDALNTYATAMDLQGKKEQAESAYVEVIGLRRTLLGPEHPDYAFTVQNFAGFIFDLGRYREAADWCGQVLALRGKSLPESQPSIAACLITLGKSEDKLGDSEAGGKALEEGVALRRRYLPANHWLIGNSEGYLGEHYTLVKQYQRAEEHLVLAHEILLKALGPGHPRIATNVKRFVALYEAWDKPAKAAELRAQLATKTTR